MYSQEAKSLHGVGDYDAMVGKGISAVGSATATVGSTLLLTKAISIGLTTGFKGFLTWGAGLSIAGAGAPVAATLILVGLTVCITGMIISAIGKDSQLETGIKLSPFGTDPAWNFAAPKAKEELRKIGAEVFSYDTSGFHDFIQGSDYVFTFSSPQLQSQSVVRFKHLFLVDDSHGKLELVKDYVVTDEPRGWPVVRTEKFKGSNLFVLRFKDEMCRKKHSENTGKKKFRFTRIEGEVQVDFAGNGMMVLPTVSEWKAISIQL